MRNFWFDVVNVLTVIALALAGILAILLVIGTLLVAAKAAILEPSCDQAARQMHVRDGDYRLLTDACWLTLNDGTRIPLDNYRASEKVQR